MSAEISSDLVGAELTRLEMLSFLQSRDYLSFIRRLEAGYGVEHMDSWMNEIRSTFLDRGTLDVNCIKKMFLVAKRRGLIDNDTKWSNSTSLNNIKITTQFYCFLARWTSHDEQLPIISDLLYFIMSLDPFFRTLIRDGHENTFEAIFVDKMPRFLKHDHTGDAMIAVLLLLADLICGHVRTERKSRVFDRVESCENYDMGRFLSTTTDEEIKNRQLLLNEHEIAKRMYATINEIRLAKLSELPRKVVSKMLEEKNKFVESVYSTAYECLFKTLNKSPDAESEISKMSSIFGTLIGDLYNGRDEENAFVNNLNEEEKSISEEDNSNVAIKTQKVYEKYISPKLAESFEINKASTAVITLNENYDYVGHVYVYPSSAYLETLDMMGIRSSVLNLLCKPQVSTAHISRLETLGLNLSTKIIVGCLLFAENNGFKFLRIDNPIGTMPRLAKELGFIDIPRWSSMFAIPINYLETYQGLGIPMPESVTDYDCNFSFNAVYEDSLEKEDLISQIQKEFLPKASREEIKMIVNQLLQTYPHLIRNSPDYIYVQTSNKRSTKYEKYYA